MGTVAHIHTHRHARTHAHTRTIQFLILGLGLRPLKLVIYNKLVCDVFGL